ncbi:alpha/beta fold hydrolase [Sinomonas sp. B1-1]|uniref:alpha/beta fold hydrolase n=1 Tax=Sinomonas sp. B1-1 TaxID=3141454 RepID=UPI003D286F59
MAETFVLVHGAWHGGWAWRPVGARLHAAGHVVHAPTSPGLTPGDDPAGVGLGVAVDALVAYVEWRDLRGVTLVGHSWGGFLLSAAAPRLADHTARGGRGRRPRPHGQAVTSAGESGTRRVP